MMSTGNQRSGDKSVVSFSFLLESVIQIIYLSIVMSVFLLLPPLVSLLTPFAFPIRNAMAIYLLSVIVIILVVTVDAGRRALGQSR